MNKESEEEGRARGRGGKEREGTIEVRLPSEMTPRMWPSSPTTGN